MGLIRHDLALMLLAASLPPLGACGGGLGDGAIPGHCDAVPRCACIHCLLTRSWATDPSP